jgi:CheY-like chemotaxis protein
MLTILDTADSKTGPAPLVTKHTLREKQHPLRILLAEDNAVNQKIVVNMLEKRGHAVRVACDGRAALHALSEHGEPPFDLILMDVQMPNMDGLEATAHIRKREKATGRHIPIIALTAHAMKGDREACLNAGMDAYVSKPLKAGELFSVIEKLKEAETQPFSSVAPSIVEKESIFNTEEALERVGGDMDFFREVIGLFSEDYPKTMAEIRKAIIEGDAAGLNRAAHFLKGSVANFGARSAYETAFKLETMGQNNDLAGAMDTLIFLGEQVEQLKRALEAFATEDGSTTSPKG